MDKNAKSLIRHAIIPSDQSIYVNYTPSVLSTEEVLRSNENSTGSGSVRKKEKKIISTAYTFSPNNAALHDKLRFSIPVDESNFTDTNIPIYFPDGKWVVEINLHRFKNRKVNEGSRNITIGAIAMQMIYLNAYTISQTDSKTYEAILKFMLSINKKICHPPLNYKEVENSVNANWQKYIDGKMDFTNCFVNKRSFWSKRSTIHGYEKLKVTRAIGDEPIIAKSKKKIKDGIQIIHGKGEKITQKKVANVAGIHEQTVKKYWDEFKSLVKDLNAKNKENSSKISHGLKTNLVVSKEDYHAGIHKCVA